MSGNTGAISTSGGYQVNAPASSGASSGGSYGALASLAFSLGYLIYSWLNSKKSEKPEPLEIQLNNYSRNTPVPIIYGQNKVNATIIYLGNMYIEEETATSQGSKGISEDSIVTGYKYYCDFAAAFGEGFCSQLRDIYIDEFYLQHGCNIMSFSYEFKGGTADQTTIPEIEDFLSSNLYTAIPWIYTCYLFISGYVKVLNKVPNIAAEIQGISLEEDEGNWQLADKLEDSFEEPLGLHFFNIKEKIYCHFVNNPVSYIDDVKYGRIYNGIYIYDNVNDTFTLVALKETYIGSIEFSSSFTFRYYDIDYEKMYFWVLDGAISIGNKYSIFYIDANTGEIVSIIIEYELTGADWYLIESNLIRIDLQSVAACNSGLNAFVVLDGKIWFFGGRYYDVGLGGDVMVASIDLSDGEPSESIPSAIPDYHGFFENNCRQTGDQLVYISSIVIEDSYIVATAIGVWIGTNFNSYTKMYIGESGLLEKWSRGWYVDDIFYDQNFPPLSPIEIEAGITGFYIRSNNLYYGGKLYYLKLHSIVYGGYTKTCSLSLYEDDCEIYTTTVDFWVYPHLYLFVVNGKLYFHYYNPNNVSNVYCYSLHYNLVVAEKSGIENYLISSNNILMGIFYDGSNYRWWEKVTNFSATTPIWCLYDFLTNERYGCGLSPSLIDGDCLTEGTTFYIEHNYCIERIVDYNGIYDFRFLYDNVFDTRKKGYDIIADILQTCRGFLYYSEGKLKVKIQKNNEEPVFYLGFHEEILTTNNSYVIDSFKLYVDLSSYPSNYWVGDIGEGNLIIEVEVEEEIVEVEIFVNFLVLSHTTTYLNIEILNVPDDPIEYDFPNGWEFKIIKDNIKKDSFQFKEKEVGDRHNKVKLQYIDRSDNYRIDVIEVEDTYWINYLGEILEQTYQMDGIKRNSQARRMAQYLLDYEIYVNWSCSFDVDILGLFFNVGNIIGFTWNQLNWSAKLFRIVSKEEMETLENKLELIEYIPDIYHDKYVELARSNYDLIKSKYAKPKHVERFEIFEDNISNRIYIFFKKDNSDKSFWIGVYCYVKFNDDIEWTNIGQLNISSPSVVLSSDIIKTTKDINFDVIYSVFPSEGSIIVGEEEIYYNRIDFENNYFYDCQRGFDGTVASVHSSWDICSLKKSNTPYYEFKESDIGKILSIRLISVTSYGLVPNNIDSAPLESMVIKGLYLLPLNVDNFRISSYVAGPSSCDITLSWLCKSRLFGGGYGNYPYGDNYGHGILSDVVQLILHIYDYPFSASGGELARVQTIDITDPENPPTSFEYTDAMNLIDHGDRIYHFEFIMFQKDVEGRYSVGSVVTTLD